MKNLTRFTLITLFFLSLSASVQAQLKYGLKAGVNLSKVHYSDEEADVDPKNRIGSQIGAIATYDIKENIGFQFGLLFSRKGFKVNESETLMGTSVKIDADLYINYLEIPLNFDYHINDLHIYAGPYLGFAVGGKGRSTVNIGGQKNTDENKLVPVFGEYDNGDLTSDEGAINAFDYGLNFALGYNLDKFIVNAGYSLGLGNIGAKEVNDDNYGEEKLMHSIFNLSLIYML